MRHPITAYRDALSAFSEPGGRWANKGRLIYLAKKAGLTVDDVIADVREAGVTNRDTDIRRGWLELDGAESTNWVAPRMQPKPEAHPAFVRNMIAAGGGSASSSDIIHRSPVAVLPTPQLQTRDFLRACYDGGDMLFIDNSQNHIPGKKGENIKTVDEWVDWCCLAGDMGGDILMPNPLTGEAHQNSSGKPSLTVSDCIASWRYCVVEFDEMPLPVQCAFWCGMIDKSPLSSKIAAITYSGGKSLHGLIRIGAETLSEWRESCAVLRRLLCSYSDPVFRCDPASLQTPRQGTRLPGVYRRGSETEVLQRLMFLNPRKG